MNPITKPPDPRPQAETVLDRGSSGVSQDGQFADYVLSV